MAKILIWSILFENRVIDQRGWKVSYFTWGNGLVGIICYAGPRMVTRPQLPSKGLTLKWQPLQWLRLSLVRPLDGNALISALLGRKTMFLIVSNFISASSNFFLSFQGQRLQKKAIYTNDYQSVMSEFWVTLLTNVKCDSHERATFSDGKKIFSDFKLLTLELLKLHHQSLKLKFLKYAAQVTTDFEPVSAQNLCPKINVTFIMVV